MTLDYPPPVAANRDRRRRTRAAIEGALRSPRANGLRFVRARLLRSFGEPWFALAEDELLGVLPDPEGDGERLPERPFGLGTILPLGRSPTGQVVGPRIEAEQGRHLAILGETGMGKSATLVAVARKAATLGGVVLFDPLGETARSFVGGFSADERQGRVVWISPSGGTAGINALEGIGPQGADPVLADRRLNDLVHALRRVRSGRYDSKYWGPRLEEMLTRALSAAAAFPAGTLTDAHTLLATGGRTRRVVPPEARDAVRELADRVRERPEDAEGARRLLYEVVRSPVLCRMLCEPEPRRHPAELVAPGRIGVISGDAAVVGESTARYLLAVYLALVWSELLARPAGPKTFVLLDESQWFAHESLSEMLRLARRRNVHVVLATQTVGSLPEGVDDAVWTNVSDFVAFRGSPEEARELARATSGVSVEELLSLPRGHAAVLLGKGNSVSWLRTVGRPPEAEASTTGAMETSGTQTPPAAERDPATGPRAASVRDVFERLRAVADSQAVPGPLRVDLSELRRSVDPAGLAVREAGAVLRREGALVSSQREDGSSVWVLDPSRIPSGPPRADASARGRETETPNLSSRTSESDEAPTERDP